IIKSTEYYFKPGLTFPRRTPRLCPKVLPAGAIFSDGGQACFPVGEWSSAALTALLASRPFFLLLKPYLPREDAAPQYQAGMIKKVPVPNMSPDAIASLMAAALRVLEALRLKDQSEEPTRVFTLPAMLQAAEGSMAERLTSWNGKIETLREEVQRAQ